MVTGWLLTVVVLVAGERHQGDGTQQEAINSWQAHMEYQAVDTGLQWKSIKGKGEIESCLAGRCLCQGEHADCRGRSLTEVPASTEGRIIKSLDLSDNDIHQLETDSFGNFTQLRDLFLKNNQLSSLPQQLEALSELRNMQLGHNNLSLDSLGTLLTGLPNLANLGLEHNQIETLTDHLFRGNLQLTILNLGYNHLSSVGPNAFKGLDQLQILELNNNLLREVPPALAGCLSLERVTLARNRIESIPAGTLKKLRRLQQIELKGNPIHEFDPDAFLQLPALRKLQLLGSPRVMNQFPNLTGCPNIELIHLDRINIDRVPDQLCSQVPRLKTLRLRSNKIRVLPDLTGCSLLQQLDLGINLIEQLPEKPFANQRILADLLLDRNKIKALSENVFAGLQNLQILDMEKNNISEIHEDAFLPLNNLKDLNLGQNSFAVLPSKGLKTVVELKAHNNPALKDFPTAESFPHIRVVRPSYAYHCCQFMPSTYENLVPEYADFGDLREDIFFPGEFDLSQFGNQTMPSVIWSTSGNASTELGEDLSLDLWENFVSGMSAGYPNIAEYDANVDVSYFRPPEGIDCYPAPGPFLPCNDLFDWWTLRCGVWIVFLLALLGNGCVVFVLSCSRNRIDVPRFLVCNLAMADFFMGLYLGFLAVLDASTLGEFRKYAIQWQLSAACEIAGFFGVLSSELSVFTLAVITMERNYAITHAMHLNKRLSLKHAAYIMIGAWSFSILMASLPLFGVSDYRKFAVCLPFETEGAVSKGYVIFLMVINGVAFFILMGCYLKMYCAIRGSQAWNSNDSRIAKRMALLVFTDFICWFPIAFFALTAAGGASLISLEAAKVFTVFVLPLNSCCNPFLYAILTKQFKKDCVMICKAIEESRVTRGIGRCRHSSNFSNRQTPANTNSINSGSGSGSHTRNNVNNGGHCNCNTKKPNKISPRWPLNKLKALLCGFKDIDGELNSQNEWNYQIAEIQHKQQKTKRHASEASSENFSSSRSDSWNKAHCIPLRFVDHHRRRNSWTVTRKASQDSNMSSSRNDSQGSNSTQSTNTWRMSRSIVSGDFNNSIARTGSGYSDKFSALTQAKNRSSTRSPLGIKKQNSSSQLVNHQGHPAIMVRGKPKLIRQVAVEADGHLAKQVSFRDHHQESSCPVHTDMASASSSRPSSGPVSALAHRYRTLYAKLTESSHEDEETNEPQQAQAASSNPGTPPPAKPSALDSDPASSSSPTSFPQPSFQASPLLVGQTPQRKLSSNPTLNLVTAAGEMRDLTRDPGGSSSSPRMPTLLSEREIKRISMENLKQPRSVDSQRRVSLGTAGQSATEALGRHPRHHSSDTNLAEPKYGPGRCTSENALVALQSKYGYSFKSAVNGSGVALSRSDNLLHSKLEEEEDTGGNPETTRLLSAPSPVTVQPTPGLGALGVPVSRLVLSPEPGNKVPRGRTPTIEEGEEPSEGDRLL